MKILVIEDETEILRTITDFLENNGFHCEKAGNKFMAEDLILTHGFDLVLLDITLPDGNGLDLIAAIRERNPLTGILILSARNSIDDRIRGLDMGADDYVTKPFHLSELNARINAILRRRYFDGNETISFRDIVIDTGTRKVVISGEETELTKKEYDLLLYFITNKNRLLTKEALAEHLWGDMIDLSNNYDFLYAHIKNLRKKIKKITGKNYFRSIYGTGYQLTE
jgi:DNA-binding response OmpR family regulator